MIQLIQIYIAVPEMTVNTVLLEKKYGCHMWIWIRRNIRLVTAMERYYIRWFYLIAIEIKADIWESFPAWSFFILCCLKKKSLIGQNLLTWGIVNFWSNWIWLFRQFSDSRNNTCTLTIFLSGHLIPLSSLGLYPISLLPTFKV